MCVIQYAITWTGSFTSLFSRILKMFCSLTSQESKCSPMDTKKKQYLHTFHVLGIFMNELWAVLVTAPRQYRPDELKGWLVLCLGNVTYYSLDMIPLQPTATSIIGSIHSTLCYSSSKFFLLLSNTIQYVCTYQWRSEIQLQSVVAKAKINHCY